MPPVCCSELLGRRCRGLVPGPPPSNARACLRLSLLASSRERGQPHGSLRPAGLSPFLGFRPEPHASELGVLSWVGAERDCVCQMSQMSCWLCHSLLTKNVLEVLVSLPLKWVESPPPVRSLDRGHRCQGAHEWGSSVQGGAAGHPWSVVTRAALRPRRGVGRRWWKQGKVGEGGWDRGTLR